MVNKTNLTTVQTICEKFSILFNRRVSASKLRTPLDEKSKKWIVGFYSVNRLYRFRVLVSDIEFANRSAAALTRAHCPDIDSESVCKSVAKHLQNNMWEVFNISANLFLDAQEHCISFDGLAENECLAKIHNEFRIVARYSIDIAGYGAGTIAVGTARNSYARDYAQSVFGVMPQRAGDRGY